MKGKRENPLLNLFLNVIIPSVVMIKFSDESYLGPTWGLITALIFPIGYGLMDLVTRQKLNFFSLLGLVSILLTGGIGLLKLSREWMIAKETLVPLVFALAVVVSGWTRYPLVKLFLGEVLLLEDIDNSFTANGYPGLFKKKLTNFSYFLALTFVLSSILNFALALVVLEGEPGSSLFNESLGKMTALSFPVISVPLMIITGIMIFSLCRSIKRHTMREVDEFLRR